MCASDDEADNVRSDLSENRAEVSGDVDAATPFIGVTQGMIVKDRMRSVLLENTNALVSSFLFRWPHFLVSLVEIAVKDNLHSGW